MENLLKPQHDDLEDVDLEELKRREEEEEQGFVFENKKKTKSFLFIHH